MVIQRTNARRNPSTYIPVSNRRTAPVGRRNADRQQPAGFPDASSFGDRRTGSRTTPLWSQGDPRWSRNTLGRNATIGSSGCAMTATAMAASQISGRPMDPGQLDAALDRNGGYSGDGLRWDVAARQFGLGTQAQDVRTQAGMNAVNAQLDAGRPVVLGVDYKAGSRGGANGTDHYITLTGRSRDAQGNSVYTANDPAGGRQITLREQNGRLVEQNPPAGRRPYQSSGPAHTFTGGSSAAGDRYDPASPSSPSTPAPTAPSTETPAADAPAADAPAAFNGRYTAAAPGADLHLGNKGPEVSQLQEQLNRLGANPPLSVDGMLGPKTQAAMQSLLQSPTLDAATRERLQTALAAAPGTTSAQPPTTETPATTTTPPVAGTRDADLSGFSTDRYDAQINAAAQRYGVPPRLLKALIEQESQFDPNARSGAGAQGLTQLMPATARELGVRNPNDPAQAIDGGARYLAQQLRAFNGDPRLALAAYNAGAGNVRRHHGIPPFRETQTYVRNIMARYQG